MIQGRIYASFCVRALAPEVVRVAEGVNEGLGLSVVEELVLDDHYMRAAGTEMDDLRVSHSIQGVTTIGLGSAFGTSGTVITASAWITFMSAGGHIVEAMLIEDADGPVCLVPNCPLVPKELYRLISIATDAAATGLERVLCARLAEGTHVSLASGAQCPVEQLVPGDRILTRDEGAQVLRGIRKFTLAAHGEAAPVRIAAGALKNARDLVVSADTRLFTAIPSVAGGSDMPPMLIEADDLTQHAAICRDQTAYREFYQLIFDADQVIFAEGLAVETMLTDLAPDAAFGEHHGASGDVLDFSFPTAIYA